MTSGYMYSCMPTHSSTSSNAPLVIRSAFFFILFSPTFPQLIISFHVPSLPAQLFHCEDLPAVKHLSHQCSISSPHSSICPSFLCSLLCFFFFQHPTQPMNTVLPSWLSHHAFHSGRRREVTFHLSLFIAWILHLFLEFNLCLTS